MSRSDGITTSAARSLQDVLETVDAEIHVLNPTPATVTRLLDIYDPEQQPQLTMYAPKATFDAALSTFPFNLTAASKLDADGATLLELPDSDSRTDRFANALVIDDHVGAVLWGTETPYVVSTEDSVLVGALHEHTASHTADTTQYDLRAPPRDELLEAFAERVGETYAEQYAALLDELDELSCRYNRTAAIDTATFAGALTGAQMYEISRATESVQFGSAASFSRRKTDLEEQGLIETEKIASSGIGRPRERLVLADDIEQSTDGVVEVLHSLHRE